MPSKAAKTPTSTSRAKKTVSKPVSKKPASKASGKTTSAKPRSTVATLSQDLKSLETRLKGADARNRKALDALETIVADLKTSAKTSNTAHKAALTRGLNILEIRMETYLNRAAEQARAGVRQELAAVTAPNAGIDTLGEAVQSAHARLDQMDTAQREAIARLNRHVADLASAVETRLSGETKARQASTAALDAKIDSVRKTFNTRIDQVELDTANALESIGDRVTKFAAVLDQRSHASDADTAERLADLAQETQSEFNTVQTDMTARLEALETIAANWSPTDTVYAANAEDPRVDQMTETVQALQAELGRMHARIAVLQDHGPTSAQAEPARMNPATLVTNVVPMPTPHAQQIMENPYADAARALEAADVPQPAPLPAPPRVQPTQQAAPKKSGPDSHIPQEFDPSAFQPTPAPQHDEMAYADLGTPQMPVAPQTEPPFIAPPPPMAPPMASVGAYSAPQTPTPAQVIEEPIMPAPLPVSTYADPAYAEGNEMRAERVGGVSDRKSPLSKLPISGRNLRVAALATGVAVVGLIAVKTILGGGDASTQQARSETPQTVASNAPASIESAFPDIASDTDLNSDLNPISVTPIDPLPPISPLGTYAETQTPDVIPGTQDTLNSAVDAGNPIAQFQKGLVMIQAGELEEGARLIRLSANRNQPAAQYRLAKLYETGTGVAKDPITARELVQRAAIGGNRIAMHDLANYYAYGQGGLDRDMGQALDWFVKAAERGVVDSQFNVAFLREGNEGVPADVETSLFWYHIAARQGDQGAPERISVLNAQLDAAAQADVKSRADRFNPKPVDEAANGIFRNVPWSKPVDKAGQARSAQILKIREAQTLLTDLGYQIGGADGAAGPKTQAAIKEFQKVNGMDATGVVTDDLIQRLEIAAGA